MACPYCGHELGVAALFGVGDQFSEAQGPSLSLDDLVPEDGNNSAWAGEGGYAPDPLMGSMPLGAKQPKARRAEPKQKEQPWDRNRGQMVHVNQDGDDDDEPAASALDALKKL
jgi:hypothetical protein